MLGLHPNRQRNFMNKSIPFIAALGFLTACGGGPASVGAATGKIFCDIVDEAKKAGGDNPLKAMAEMTKLMSSDKYKAQLDAQKEKAKDFTPEQRKEADAAMEKACPKYAEFKKLGK